MIELVKTPGRKRTAVKKARAATTATKAQVLTVSDWEVSYSICNLPWLLICFPSKLDLEKENRAPSVKSSEGGTPLNSFHKALLQSQKHESIHIQP